jgi:SAM-dependent methyltransferase
VDVSPAMLDAVRSRSDGSGLDNVECVEAGFLTYEHYGDPPDVFYSRNALHHLPDLWKAVALERIAALLRPGGVMLLHDIVFSCSSGELRQVVNAWLDNAPQDAAEGWSRSELEQHLAEEHSTFSWLLEPMLERAGFEIVEARHRPAKTHALYVLQISV